MRLSISMERFAAAALVAGLAFAQGMAADKAASDRLSANAAPTSAHVTSGDIRAAFGQLSSIYPDDEPIRVVNAGAYNIGAFAVGRPKRTGPARIDNDGAVNVTEGLQLSDVADVVVIREGAGAMVTGGTLVGATRISSDDPDLPVIGPGRRGRAIRGGDSRRVAAGDIVIIPAGIAHGFSEIESPLKYLVLRIDGGKTLPLK